MRSALPALLLASLAASSGCGEGGDPLPPADGAPPTAELQAGSALADGTGFVDVVDGQDVELIAGAQGGFHVWINVKVLGAEGDLQLEREATKVSDGALVLAGLKTPLTVPHDAMIDWWQNPQAPPSFMCPTPVGLSVIDQQIRIAVKLKDANDTVLGEDTVVVTPHCPEGANHDWCQMICSGN